MTDDIVLRLPDGIDFAIGTGFSDRVRETPPAIGATVTFRYQELSDAGVPRFPSWVGVRHDLASAKPVTLPTPPPAAPASIGTGGGTTGKPRYFEFVEGNSSKFLGSLASGQHHDDPLGSPWFHRPVKDKNFRGRTSGGKCNVCTHRREDG